MYSGVYYVQHLISSVTWCLMSCGVMRGRVSPDEADGERGLSKRPLGIVQHVLQADSTSTAL